MQEGRQDLIISQAGLVLTGRRDDFELLILLCLLHKANVVLGFEPKALHTPMQMLYRGAAPQPSETSNMFPRRRGRGARRDVVAYLGPHTEARVDGARIPTLLYTYNRVQIRRVYRVQIGLLGQRSGLPSAEPTDWRLNTWLLPAFLPGQV